MSGRFHGPLGLATITIWYVASCVYALGVLINRRDTDGKSTFTERRVGLTRIINILVQLLNSVFNPRLSNVQRLLTVCRLLLRGQVHARVADESSEHAHENCRKHQNK